MTGILNPVVGALVHNAGSVIVIVNSALLLKWKHRGGSEASGDASVSYTHLDVYKRQISQFASWNLSYSAPRSSSSVGHTNVKSAG